MTQNGFERGRGSGPYAKLIAQRFSAAIRRYDLNTPRERLRTDLFRCPEGPNGQIAIGGMISTDIAQEKHRVFHRLKTCQFRYRNDSLVERMAARLVIYSPHGAH